MNAVRLTDWADIVGYEGLYRISNNGDVKSLMRKTNKWDGERTVPQINLKPSMSPNGYLRFVLCKQGIVRTFSAHALVWDHFGNSMRDGLRLQVDHIDGNKVNNHINNLQILSHQENISKGKAFIDDKTSKYPGVYWAKDRRKWRAKISNNGIKRNIGCYANEYYAYIAYKYFLNLIKQHNAVN